MPYENEHACRLRNPADFQKDSFRRTSRKHNGKAYDVIMGRLKGEDSMTEQAYRYKKSTWTASQARQHCKDHDGSFEAAKGSKSAYPKGIEERNLEGIEWRSNVDEPPRIGGYAAKYGVFTDLGWFKEKIASGAFDEVLKTNDVRCLKNHNSDLIIGRTTNKSLRLESNTVGLKFECDIPNTSTGTNVFEEVRKGLLSGCSFAFIVAKDGESWNEKADPPERTIKKVGQLFDVGPVTYPAYPDTTVAARSLERFRAEHRDQEDTDDDKSTEPEISDQTNAAESVEKPEESQAKESVNAERQRELRRKYHDVKRIIARNRLADVQPAAPGRGSGKGPNE